MPQIWSAGAANSRKLFCRAAHVANSLMRQLLPISGVRLATSSRSAWAVTSCRWWRRYMERDAGDAASAGPGEGSSRSASSSAATPDSRTNIAGAFPAVDSGRTRRGTGVNAYAIAALTCWRPICRPSAAVDLRNILWRWEPLNASLPRYAEQMKDGRRAASAAVVTRPLPEIAHGSTSITIRSSLRRGPSPVLVEGTIRRRRCCSAGSG